MALTLDNLKNVFRNLTEEQLSQPIEHLFKLDGDKPLESAEHPKRTFFKASPPDPEKIKDFKSKLLSVLTRQAYGLKELGSKEGDFTKFMMSDADIKAHVKDLEQKLQVEPKDGKTVAGAPRKGAAEPAQKPLLARVVRQAIEDNDTQIRQAKLRKFQKENPELMQKYDRMLTDFSLAVKRCTPEQREAAKADYFIRQNKVTFDNYLNGDFEVTGPNSENMIYEHLIGMCETVLNSLEKELYPADRQKLLDGFTADAGKIADEFVNTWKEGFEGNGHLTEEDLELAKTKLADFAAELDRELADTTEVPKFADAEARLASIKEKVAAKLEKMKSLATELVESAEKTAQEREELQLAGNAFKDACKRVTENLKTCLKEEEDSFDEDWQGAYGTFCETERNAAKIKLENTRKAYLERAGILLKAAQERMESLKDASPAEQREAMNALQNGLVEQMKRLHTDFRAEVKTVFGAAEGAYQTALATHQKEQFVAAAKEALKAFEQEIGKEPAKFEDGAQLKKLLEEKTKFVEEKMVPLDALTPDGMKVRYHEVVDELNKGYARISNAKVEFDKKAFAKKIENAVTGSREEANRIVREAIKDLPEADRAAAEKVLGQLIDRELQMAEDAIPVNDDSPAAADLKSNFATALGNIRSSTAELVGKLKMRKAGFDDAKARFDTAVQSLKGIRDELRKVTGPASVWSFEKSPKLMVNGRKTATAKVYLEGRLEELDALIARVEKAAADPFASFEALNSAADEIAKFNKNVDGLLGKSGKDAAKLVSDLRSLATPDVRVWDFRLDVEGVDLLKDMPELTDGAKDIPGAVEGLVELKRNLQSVLDEFSALTDVNARKYLQILAREALTQATEALNAAAANRVEMGPGVAGILRNVWSGVAQFTLQLKHEKLLSDFETAFAAANLKLDQAWDNPPAKMKCAARTQRMAAITAARADLMILAKAVRAKMAALRHASELPDKTSFNAILKELDTAADAKFGKYLASLDNVKAKKFTRLDLGSHLTMDEKSSDANGWMSVDGAGDILADLSGSAMPDPLAVMAQGDYGSLDDLNKAVEDAKQTAREQKASERDETWKAFSAKESLSVDRANEERLKTADAKTTEILNGPKRTFAADDARGAEILKRIEAENLRLKAEQEAAERLRAEQRKNSAEAKLVEKAERARAARELEQARNTAFTSFDKQFGETFDSAAQSLRKNLSALFLDCPDVGRYMLRDGDGNFAGWSRDGENIIAIVLDEQLKTIRMTAFEHYFEGVQKGEKGETGKLVTFADVDSLKALSEARRAYETRYGFAEKPDARKGLSPYPRGTDLFGLDIGKMERKDVEGLKMLLRGVGFARNEKEAERLMHDRHVVNANTLSFEKAIHEGRIVLGEINPAFLSMVSFACLSTETAWMVETNPTVNQYLFNEKDFLKVFDLLVAAGVNPSKVAAWSDEQRNKHVELLAFLYAYNSNSMEGIDAVCRRLLGCSVDEASAILADSGNPKCADVQSKYEALLPYTRRLDADADWRSYGDPYVRLKPLERQVVGMVRMTHDYRADDANQLKLFRSALEKLSSSSTGTPVRVTFESKKEKVALELKRGPDDSLTATVSVTKSEYVKNKDGYLELKRSGETMPLLLDVPESLTVLKDQISRVILAQVGTYGLDEALAVFAARRTAVGEGTFDTSSEARQMALSILKGYAGLDATRLSTVSTPDLVKLVSVHLKGKYAWLMKADPDVRKTEIENGLPVDPLAEKMLNSQATIDVYSRYVNATAEEKSKVFVPDPPVVRKGETLEEARTRRFHAFVSELIQPGDTTKFDIDLKRLGGDRDALLRETLFANRETLLEMMAMDEKELLGLFAMQGQGGRRLDVFAETVVKMVRGLKAVREGVDSDAKFIANLESAHHAKTGEVIREARIALSDSSAVVLEQLQTSFVSLFTDAFGNLSKTNLGPVWKKSLDELARSVSIDPEKGYGLFLKKVLGAYFLKMSEVDRLRMTSLVMRYATPDASLGQLLGSLLKGSGPILQKLMQGLPQSALPKELQEAVEDLKSNLAPIPEEAVRAYLHDAVAGSNGEILGITVVRSLGAASVGQAFLCTVRTKKHPEGESCVVKILRPDVQSRARREKEFFTAMIKDEKMGAMLNDRFDRIFDEFDLSIEATNIASGGVYDPDTNENGSPRVHSMKLHPAGPVTTNVLFLREAPGETYDRYLARVRTEKEKLLEHLEIKVEDGHQVYEPKDVYAFQNTKIHAARLIREMTARQRDLADFVAQWTEEVAFGNGFFHGDVHAGNIMTSETGLTVIDYGNASRFTEQEREAILQLLLKATFNHPSEFLAQFKGLLSEEGKAQLAKLNSNTLVNDLATIFEKGGRADAGKRFIAALQHIQNLGIGLPGPLFNLTECMRRLDESVTALEKEIATLRTIFDNVVDSGDDRKSPEWSKGAYWFDTAFVEAWSKGKEPDEPAIRKDLQRELKAACTSRRAFEEKMADVRRLLGRSDLNLVYDFHKDILEAFAVVEDDPDFFKPDMSDSDRRHEVFADRLSRVLVNILSRLHDDIAPSSEMQVGTNAFFGTAESFAGAIGTAVMRHEGKVRQAVGFGGGIKMYVKRETKGDPKELAYGQRLEMALDYIERQEAFEGMTEQEVQFLQPFGKYFRTPPDFEKRLKSSWTNTSDSINGVLDVFRHTLDEMRRKHEESPLATSSQEPTVLYAQYLGVLFAARFENSGFGKSMVDGDFAKVLKEAGDDKELVAFLRQLRVCATAIPG